MDAKKKILVIGYGGTIVMVVDPVRKAIVPSNNPKEILSLVPNVNEAADITMEIIENKDSTDIGPDDWSRLAMYIYDHQDKFDGFVVTHGTNTMAYTASALTLAFGRTLKKPIILTGSQLPLTVYGNDARFNFENAIKAAVVSSEQQIAEVMIVFSDLILRGGRSVKTSESKFRAFESPAFPEIGTITSTGIHFNYHAIKADLNSKLEIHPRFNTNIISVDLTPGQSPSLIDFIVRSGKCHGVILKSYGAGSVPIHGEMSFIPFIQRSTNEYKVPVIVSSKFLGGNSFKEINDENAVKAIEAGAIPAKDMTDVMTEVKLMWLLGLNLTNREELQKQLHTNFAGEI
jgi:L-asparaginase